LGGIEQSEKSVAYKDALITPQIVNGMDDVSTDFKTPYGTIVSKWKKTADGIVVEVEIPVNTTAILVLPAKEGTEISIMIEGIPNLKKVIRYKNTADLEDKLEEELKRLIKKQKSSAQ